jgi:hypothetical protein
VERTWWSRATSSSWMYFFCRIRNLFWLRHYSRCLPSWRTHQTAGWATSAKLMIHEPGMKRHWSERRAQATSTASSRRRALQRCKTRLRLASRGCLLRSVLAITLSRWGPTCVCPCQLPKCSPTFGAWTAQIDPGQGWLEASSCRARPSFQQSETFPTFLSLHALGSGRSFSKCAMGWWSHRVYSRDKRQPR